jgi:tetratricopeptide (TPR) repeat protein
MSADKSGQPPIAERTQRAGDALMRASAAGDERAIADAVAEFEQITQIADGSAFPTAMLNVINALFVQAEVSNSDTALDRALELLDDHEDSFPDDGLRSLYLAKRGNALLMKAQRSRDPSVMAEAVKMLRGRQKLASKGHEQHGVGLYDLAMALLHKGTMFDKPGDLYEAVNLLEAAKRRPDDSVPRAAVLSGLGDARLARIQYVSRQDKQKELDAALEAHRLATDAVRGMEPGDPIVAACMTDAATALMRAYVETGDQRPLATSVDACRAAADVTPPGHYRKAERLSNLASTLVALHEVTADAEILDEAIRTSRTAVAAANPSHANRLSCLFTLAYGLFRRGELRQMLVDFDEAAVLARNVAEATDEDDARWAMRQAFHAQTTCYLPNPWKLRRAGQDLTEAARQLRHDNPDRAMIVSNHGALMNALADLLLHEGNGAEARQHAAEAVQLARQGMQATPFQHSEYLVRVLNFVAASTTLSRLDHDTSHLDIALSMREETQNHPSAPEAWGTLLELGYADALACQYELSTDPGTAAAAIDAYRRGTSDARVAAVRRLEAAHTGARFAAGCGETRHSLELYELAIGLLDSVVWRGMDRRDQERVLARHAELPSDAAAIATRGGQAELAIEFLERGRGVLLSRILDDSADIARLRQISPVQADRLADLQLSLDGITMPDPAADQPTFPERPPEQASEADERSAFACQIQNVIEEIRAEPDRADLFTPPRFADLRTAIAGKWVAVINISSYGCDAIVLTPGWIKTVSLPGLTRHAADDAATFFRVRAQNAVKPGQAGRVARQSVITRLAWLWDTVTGPVLEETGITEPSPAGTDDVPLLYWCPTGSAVFLPLHAAGYHEQTDLPAQLAVIERTESVYVPKLRVLAPIQAEPAACQKTTTPPLVVSMPTTPGMSSLPGTQAEGNRLTAEFPGSVHLSGADATRSAVAAGIDAHHWYHFAVHGITDNDTPVDGGLELVDGRLTIRDLMQLRLVDTTFAYLSACETYQSTQAIPDESVTVATALCVAGCQIVVASLWQVADDHAAEFARQVYNHLISYQNKTPTLLHAKTPRALRETALAIRNAHPGQPERWAALVCTTR